MPRSMRAPGARGTWVPATPIHWIKEGSFNGVSDTAHGVKTHQPMPICFLPQNVDNSGGGQVWVTSDKWGPLKGSLLNISYGYGKIFVVPHETVAGQIQGGMCALPLPSAPTGIMRGRFHRLDGQL